MIEGGISFQPGAPDSFDQRREEKRQRVGSDHGVQDAIKVLSLRLPKIVGSHAVAPTNLLSSQGSGGNRRADSIVETLMQKYFPTSGLAQAAPMAPGEPTNPAMSASGPRFDGVSSAQPRRAPETPRLDPSPQLPRVIVGLPPSLPEWFGIGPQDTKWPNMPTIDGGGFVGSPGAVDRSPLPDLRQQLNWLPEPSQLDETPLI